MCVEKSANGSECEEIWALTLTLVLDQISNNRTEEKHQEIFLF